MSEQTAHAEPHRVLDLLTRIRDVKDTQISELLNLHRNSVKKKRNGLLPLNDIETQLLARAFDVPAHVFTMSGLGAMQWATENRPQWFTNPADDGAPVTNSRVTQLAAKLQEPAGVVQWNYSDMQPLAA